MVGNPSGPLGQLPYKAEQLLLAGFKAPSIAKYHKILAKTDKLFHFG